MLEVDFLSTNILPSTEFDSPIASKSGCFYRINAAPRHSCKERLGASMRVRVLVLLDQLSVCGLISTFAGRQILRSAIWLAD